MYKSIPIDQHGRPYAVLYGEVEEDTYVPVRVSVDGSMVSKQADTNLETEHFDVDDETPVKVLDTEERDSATISNTSTSKTLYFGSVNDAGKLKSDGGVLFPGQAYTTKASGEIYVIADSDTIDVRIVKEIY